MIFGLEVWGGGKNSRPVPFPRDKPQPPPSRTASAAPLQFQLSMLVVHSPCVLCAFLGGARSDRAREPLCTVCSWMFPSFGGGAQSVEHRTPTWCVGGGHHPQCRTALRRCCTCSCCWSVTVGKGSLRLISATLLTFHPWMSPFCRPNSYCVQKKERKKN